LNNLIRIACYRFLSGTKQTWKGSYTKTQSDHVDVDLRSYLLIIGLMATTSKMMEMYSKI
jgi:hypothetical protein